MHRPLMSRAGTQQLKVLLGCLLGLVSVLLAGYFYFVRPQIVFGTQALDTSNLLAFSRCLHEYKRIHGQFPPAFTPAVMLVCFPSGAYVRDGSAVVEDRWRNPVFYKSDGEVFILVALGRGGDPDRADYGDLDSWIGLVPTRIDVCGQAEADLIETHLGLHTGCGK